MLYLDNQKPTSSVQNTRPPKQNVKNAVKEDPQKTNTTSNPKVGTFIENYFLYFYCKGTLRFGKNQKHLSCTSK